MARPNLPREELYQAGLEHTDPDNPPPRWDPPWRRWVRNKLGSTRSPPASPAGSSSSAAMGGGNSSLNEEHITAGSSSTTPTQYRRVKVVVDRKDDGVARANFYDPPTSLAYGMAVNMAAGGVAGAGVDAILFPLDTIKTRLQARKAGAPLNEVFSGKKFYRGLGVNTAGSFLSSGLFFAVYDTTKKYATPIVRQYNEALVPLAHVSGAVLGDVVACSFRVPFEGIKQRLQAGVHSTTTEAFFAVYNKRGVRGLYAGYTSTLLREIPFDAIEFVLYEFMRKHYLSYHYLRKQRTPSGMESGILGAVAGGVAAFITTPLDVVKTRMMTQTAEKGDKEFYGTVKQSLRRIYLEEGYKGLYAGCMPRMLWISMGGAIFFSLYEGSRKAILGYA